MGVARLKNLASGGIKDYYSAGKDDYYDTEESNLQLAGTGVELYGLDDRFNAEKFEALSLGENGHHRKAKDLTLSPPKSVSLLFALGNPRQSKDALEAHRQAVRETIDYIEHSGMVTTRRRTEDHIESVPASGLVVACFEHATNRNQDPNLHSHCLIANACRAQDSEAISNLNYHAIYRNQKHLGQVYDSALINALTTRGYSIRQKANSFELAGIDDQQLADFSTRKNDIVRNLAANNKSYETATDDERQRACFATRRKKETKSLNELSDEWQERAQASNLDLSRLNSVKSQTAPRHTHDAVKASFMREAIQETSDFNSTFTAKSVYGRAISLARESGEGLSPREARDLFKQEAPLAGVLSLPNQAEASWLKHEMTTVDLVQAELDFCNRLTNNRDSHAPALPPIDIETGITNYNRSLEEKKGYTLKNEQAEMVRHILGNRDLMSIIQGDAGTGKTTALDAVADIYGRDKIRGLALQAVAAKNLENETGITSSSIDRFLNDFERSPEKSEKAIRNGLIIVDEAAMVDSRKMNRISEIAEQTGAKLCLVGDTKQLEAVGAGQPMAMAMEEELATTHYLSDIRRQQDKDHLEAVKAIASDQSTEKLIAALAKRGIIKEVRTKESRHRAIAREVTKDWSKGIRPLVITSLNKDRENLNAVIRHELKTQGLLPKGQDIVLALEGQSGEPITRKMAKGDIIVFNRNDRRRDIENGNLGTIEKFNPQSLKLTVRLDKDQGIRTIDLKKYKNLDHAYALSTYKSQGQTVTKCIYDANTKSPLLSKNEFYVGISRHKKHLAIFTDNINKIPSQLLHSRPRSCALRYFANTSLQPLTKDSCQRFKAKLKELDGSMSISLPPLSLTLDNFDKTISNMLKSTKATVHAKEKQRAKHSLTR